MDKNIKHLMFEPGKHLFLDTRRTKVILLFSQPLPAPPFQPLRHQRNICYQGGVLADQTDESHYRPSPGCKADVQEGTTVVPEITPVLLVLCGVWHCYD
jgi:hypothetical protein